MIVSVEQEDFLKWLKNDDYSLYTKYKNKKIDLNDYFRIVGAKILYSDSRKKQQRKESEYKEENSINEKMDNLIKELKDL